MGSTAVMFCKITLGHVKERERKEKKGSDEKGRVQEFLVSNSFTRNITSVFSFTPYAYHGKQNKTKQNSA